MYLNIARKKYVLLMEALQILDKKTEKVGEDEMANLLLEGSAKKVCETILSNSKSQNHTMKGKEKKEKSTGKMAINKRCALIRQYKKEKSMMRLIL